MSVSSARDTFFLRCGVIFCICLWAAVAWADDVSILNKVTPIISFHDNSSSQDMQSLQLTTHKPFSPLLGQEINYSPPLKKNIVGQDLFSLALGARFKISEWLGIGAACTMPLTFEETTVKEDLSIEAMVTMQF